ncbi:uncharacterized protein MICPUCDRAFT_66077 [Micromonas pusilla CCMP1545]|uniref:Predicted protein n=1 Tax=Micromonas pusilla (strain CCMP1545) TaxID=564608 RepID=C1NAH5_MICPC|nr:uncharacterized protein MICPUCDRAFT_66077 [Micromonas pusilla CCMP1545]EEH50891.1 predicted protein [Micromonas pusilla CCMP1545]|eukprot:XP_003064911.1 predicted protein [Micromonas pusilla CCMP1545]
MHLNSTPSGMTSSNFAEGYFLQASSSSAPTGLVRETCVYFFFCFLPVYNSLKSVQYTVRSTSTSVFSVCSSPRSAASFRTTGKLRMSHSLRMYSCSRTSNLWSREVDPVTVNCPIRIFRPDTLLLKNDANRSNLLPVNTSSCASRSMNGLKFAA